MRTIRRILNNKLSDAHSIIMKKAIFKIFGIIVLILTNSTLHAQTNYALNKPVSVSSIRSANKSGDNAVDGTSSKWVSGTGKPQWLEIDLQDDIVVNEVNIDFYNSIGEVFKIQYWDGGWQDLLNITNGTQQIFNATFAGQLTNKVRIEFTETSKGRCKIQEFEIYGYIPPDAPSSPSVSSNVCGPKTVTRATPPAGETWYWQTSSGGTSELDSNLNYVVSNEGNNNIYLRSKNNSNGSWGPSTLTVVTILPALSAGTLNSDQTICYNDDPVIISGTSASGGDGSYTYQWKSRTPGGLWSDAPGVSTNVSYDPPALITTMEYKREVSSCSTTEESNVVTITVHPALVVGSISGAQTICNNADPTTITGIAASGGDDSYAYQWKSRTPGGSWSDAIGTSTNASYDPPALTTTMEYKREDTSCSSTLETNVITITVLPELVGGSISSDQTLCYNGDAGILSGASASGGDGSYVYQWKSRTPGGSWSDAPGVSTNASYDPPALTTTMEYKREVNSCSATAESNVVTITIHHLLAAGTISSVPTVCYNGIPSSLTESTSASGGDGSYTYQWKSRTPGGSWSDAPGVSTNVSYDPPALITTMEYKREVSSCSNTQESNVVTVVVNPALNAGSIGGTQSVCESEDPTVLNSLADAIGGNGIYSYQWQKSISPGVWVDIVGANQATYDPGILPTSTDFRRRVNSCDSQLLYSNEIQITVFAEPATPAVLNASYSYLGASVQLDTNPAGETRYWQSNALGTSESDESGSFLIDAPGTYYVRSKNTNGCWSVGAGSFIMIAAEPTNLTANAVSNEAILISWAAVTGNESAFVISRSASMGGSYVQVHSAGGQDTQYLDENLSIGTKYYYRIQAQESGQVSSALVVKDETTLNVFNGDETIEHTPTFNGNISGMRWKGASDNEEKVFTYSYDGLNRLKSAQYAAMVAGSYAKNKGHFSVPDISYDLNGNITNVTRQGLNAANNADIIDELTYDYGIGGSNQLKKVDDLRGPTGFKDGTNQTEEYFYDANGNMVKDLNKGIDSIYYNHLNLPMIVDMINPGDSIVYIYDAAGTKIQQKVFQADTLFKTTDYVGQFIYETKGQGTRELQFMQHDEGRIVKDQNGDMTYQYHLKDHLGNTRATFTTGQYTSGYLATFEDATYAQDTTDFFNLVPDPRVPYPVGGKAVRLNNSDPIGPGFASAVSRGDTISMSVKAYYEDITGHTTNNIAVANIAAALTTAFGGVNGASEAQQTIYDIFNNDPAVTSGLLSGNNPTDNKPAAYLNYLLFDVNNNFVDAGYFGVQEGPNLEQTISVSDLVIDQAGFIYIYVSNESNSSNYVFFDNLDIAISESPVLETTDYYPFGLTFNSYTKPGTIDQNFKYNGKEEINDLGVNWQDYGARMYDAVLGRWHVVDPMNELMPEWSPYNYALNDPIRFVDPDGMIPWPVNRSFGDFVRRVSSWFGPRNVANNPDATTDHMGLDINFGGGTDDYGAPVLATHDGIVHEVKDDTSGNGGRRVVIQAADGSFQTLYFHLSTISVEDGQRVKEGQQIGEIGSSAFDSETGTDSHLHYAIMKKNVTTMQMEWYNPTEGNGNEESNIVDPQSWLNDPIGDAFKSAMQAMEGGNWGEFYKWIDEFNRLRDEEDEND
ncbi:MAG: peptidoglycan DD-metalloendopeptidase family protein [Cyclobacteriaceae bacterium]